MENRTDPLVSIIIPAYNKAYLTSKAIDSLLNQTYGNIEVIVVDDGSTDDTRKLLAAYGDKILYRYKENGGACSARNMGISLSKGEYLGFLDCDDQYLPEKIQKSVAYLESHHDAGMVYSAAYFVNENGELLGLYSHPQSKHPGWITKRLIMRNFICNSSPILRRSCLDAVGVFDESVFMPADWDLWLRISEKFQVGYLDEPLTKYMSVENYILKNIELCQKEEIKMLEKAFTRDARYRGLLKRKVLASHHLRYALCYFLLGKKERLKSELLDTLNSFPFDVKTYGIIACLACAPNILKKRLTNRIYKGQLKSCI